MPKLYSRSKEVAELTIEGRKTQLANSLKMGVPLSFWYYIKYPCGGWVEFDIRDVDDLKEWTNSAEFQTLSGTPKILPVLAKKLQARCIKFEQMKYTPASQPQYIATSAPYNVNPSTTDDLPF